MKGRAVLVLFAAAACLAGVPVVGATAFGPAQMATADQLGFVNYATPPNLPQNAGEPSIGVNVKTGNVMFEAGPKTFRVEFDDSKSPASAAWEDKSALTSVTTFDPILFTDQNTNRTFATQLALACALSSYTDDDGDNWTPTQGCSVGQPEDHPSVGGGPFHTAALKNAAVAYPDIVYYCHQDGVLGQGFILFTDGQAAYCGTSLDGGLTYGPGVPIYTGNQCGGLHGHIKVGPDGTAYVPNQGCVLDQPVVTPTLVGEYYKNQAVIVSEDDGLTWQVRPVTGSRWSPYSDPSVGIASDGTAYFGFQDGGFGPNGRFAKISVSHDHGVSWSEPIDVGRPFHIQNIEFPEVVAGDPNRAAFAFLGSPTPGDDQDPNYPGVFDLYVATTYDGGKTWITTDATPGDPVQRGCIQLLYPGGPQCPHRNLLDFNDMTVDAKGRVLVAFADGCTAKCVNSTNPADNKYTAVGTIARQSRGRGLYATHDAELAGVTAVAAAQAAPAGSTLGIPNTSRGPGGPVIAVGALVVLTGLTYLAHRGRGRRVRAWYKGSDRALPRYPRPEGLR